MDNKGKKCTMVKILASDTTTENSKQAKSTLSVYKISQKTYLPQFLVPSKSFSAFKKFQKAY